MLDAPPFVGLGATLIGPMPSRAVHEGAKGSVRATFDRTFYVSLAGVWICVGPVDLGAGPLNILCDKWPDGRSASDLLKIGDGAEIEKGVLRAGGITVRLAAAALWRPKPSGAWSRATLARGLAAFNEALPSILPQEGLARILRGSGHKDTPILAAAQKPIQHLTQLLHDARDGDAGEVNSGPIVSLIGLGPGLTPSGDDYLGGALVALSLTGHIGLRDRIWCAVKPQLCKGTNDVSRAHLGAAAEGFGSAALHGLLGAILVGAADAISAAIAPVAAIGHTSGWDALAGAITVLRSLRGQSRSAPLSSA